MARGTPPVRALFVVIQVWCSSEASLPAPAWIRSRIAIREAWDALTRRLLCQRHTHSLSQAAWDLETGGLGDSICGNQTPGESSRSQYVKRVVFTERRPALTETHSVSLPVMSG